MGSTSTPSSPLEPVGGDGSHVRRAIFWESVSSDLKGQKSISGSLSWRNRSYVWKILPTFGRAVLYQEVSVESAVMRVVGMSMDFIEEPALDWFCIKITNERRNPL